MTNVHEQKAPAGNPVVIAAVGVGLLLIAAPGTLRAARVRGFAPWTALVVLIALGLAVSWLIGRWKSDQDYMRQWVAGWSGVVAVTAYGAMVFLKDFAEEAFMVILTFGGGFLVGLSASMINERFRRPRNVAGPSATAASADHPVDGSTPV